MVKNRSKPLSLIRRRQYPCRWSGPEFAELRDNARRREMTRAEYLRWLVHRDTSRIGL
jgi:hypothetical protein